MASSGEPPEDLFGLDADRSTDLHELHDLQPSLPSFVLGDKRLVTAQSLSQALLRQSGLFTSGDQAAQKLLMLRTPQGFQ